MVGDKAGIVTFMGILFSVIPAQTGIHSIIRSTPYDPSLRRDDMALS
jgi:hypothetical protein